MNRNQGIKNLDILCAEKGYKLAGIPKMEERILNAALTVLEEQGPYAMCLYLKARHSGISEEAEKIFKNLLQEVFGSKLNNHRDALKMISALAENLDDLLFARDLLLKTFSYARYHLKAIKGREEAS